MQCRQIYHNERKYIGELELIILTCDLCNILTGPESKGVRRNKQLVDTIKGCEWDKLKGTLHTQLEALKLPTGYVERFQRMQHSFLQLDSPVYLAVDNHGNVLGRPTLGRSLWQDWQPGANLPDTMTCPTLDHVYPWCWYDFLISACLHCHMQCCGQPTGSTGI